MKEIMLIRLSPNGLTSISGSAIAREELQRFCSKASRHGSAVVELKSTVVRFLQFAAEWLKRSKRIMNKSVALLHSRGVLRVLLREAGGRDE